MPEAPAKPTTAQQQDELLLLAEKIGEVSDRLAQIETEFTAQTAPLDAARGTQESALAALNAALAGIKALNFHVLDNNLGAVSKRVETVAEQATKSIEALDQKLTEFERVRNADAKELAHQFSLTEQRRTELAAKRDHDAQEFARAQSEIRRDIETQLGRLRDDLRQLAATTPTSFNPRGDWDAQTTYTKLDVVTLNGTSYVSRESDNTEKPGRGSKRWQVLARRGGAALGGGATDITGVAGLGATGLQLAQSGTESEARTILGVEDFTGATADDAGAAGRVPAPSAGDQNKYLRADGTWFTPATVTAPAASQSTVNTGTADDEFVAPLTLHGYVNPRLATRQPANYLLCDGVTTNRRMELAPGAPGNVAGLPTHFHAWVDVPTTNPSANGTIFALVARHTDANTNGFSATMNSDGTAGIYQTAADFNNRRQFLYFGFRAAYSGRRVLLTVDFPSGDSTTNPVVAVDGVDISSSFTLSTAGTAPNWMPTTLDCTKFLSASNWPAGRAPLAEYGPGAWSPAEVLTYAQTGVKPSWWAAGTGSAVAIYSSNFSAGADTFSAQVGTATGNVDGVSDGTTSKDNCLRYVGSGAAGWPSLARANTLTIGWRHSIRLEYYIPSANTLIKKIYPGSVSDLRQTGASVGIYDIATTSGTWTTVQYDFVATYTTLVLGLATAANSTNAANTDTVYIGSVIATPLGPIARHTLQPGATVHPDDGANKLPLLLTSGVTAVGSTPNEVVIPGPAMTADGFVHADQVITPTGYELVAAYALQTGTATSTITVKETSSGGTTVATGALSASVTRVALTVSNGLLAGGKKLHLANSSWASNTVTPFFVFRRAS